MLLALLFHSQEVFGLSLAGRLDIIDSVTLWLSSVPPGISRGYYFETRQDRFLTSLS